MEYSHRLNELKSLILSKCGIKFMTPADCKRISIEISKQLNKNVSETTIKRLFGFAVVKHKFSTFTLTTLAEYVDMANNSAAPAVIKLAEEITDNWSILKQKADKITNFTLKTIRNRSGLPYEMTVSRKFAEHDFDEFYHSDFIFTCFISQPGYGKTILLSHLSEDLFYQPDAPYAKSTLFFVKAYTFFNAETVNSNIEDQLRDQLQIDPKENTLDYINHIQTVRGGKFIIIIDAFGELVLKKEEKGLLYDNIINFICSLEDYKNIKLVMSMRSTSWTRFYDRMRHSAYMKSKWFPGNYFNLNDLSNVPPLSEKEIDSIVSKINFHGIKEISPRLKSQLKFPFHIQLYYQLKEEHPDFNYYTNITFYELVSRFIQEKIYRSNYYTEKILFLKKVIQLTEYGKKTSSVEKDALLTELSAFRNAYMELLSDGILMEEKQSDTAHPKEYVRFLHPHMFEYFLFVEILEKFHLQTNKEFFNYINKEYDANQVRFQLFQWATRFLIKTGNFKSLRYIFKLNLDSFENNYLILFMAEEVKYRSKYNNDLIRLLEEDAFHDVVISKLINFDFIDSCYKEAVIALIRIAKKDDHLLIYNSILAVLAMIRMNKEELKEVLTALQELDDSKWMIKPAELVEIIYAKLNNDPPVHLHLVEQIREFGQGKNAFAAHESGHMDINQGICYLLILSVNLFTGDSITGIDIITNIVKLHPKDFTKRTTLCIYILNLYGLYSSRVSPGKKIDQIENILILLSKRNDKIFTSYQEALLMMLQAQQAYNRKEFDIAIDCARECLLLFKRNDIVLHAMFMFNLLIKIFTDLNNYDMVNEYKYEKLCLLDDHKVPKNLL
jgi:hypothetical protein